MSREIDLKYRLYENAVQSVEHDVRWFAEIFTRIRGREALHLREDFCGTFRLAAEWVERDPRATALVIDLDREPLAFGRREHLARLSADARRRIKILVQNVVSVTRPLSDVIIAFNFSFNVFKKRAELVRYLTCCRKSLASDGIVILELAGGPGMVEKLRERRTVKVAGKTKFEYTWHQQSFNPITHEAHYAIHFKLPNGRVMNDAFTYDWRVWTIPELRDAMEDAGFSRSVVYWESQDEEYVETEAGTNDWSWIAYVVGMK